MTRQGWNEVEGLRAEAEGLARLMVDEMIGTDDRTEAGTRVSNVTMAVAFCLRCDSQGYLDEVIELLSEVYGFQLYDGKSIGREVARQVKAVMEERDALRSENEALRMALGALEEEGRE